MLQDFDIKKTIEDVENKKEFKYLKVQEGNLIITDLVEDTSDYKKYVKQLDQDNIDENKKVLVHCTNYFPKDNKIMSTHDGGKVYTTKVTYNGITKEAKTLSHRHEVHCTINNRVESTSKGEGNWDDIAYIIVERFDIHKDEFELVNSSDSWTKGTNIDLSEDAVILVKLQDKDNLPISKENTQKYNIIYYDGNPTYCLRNFLKMNNYEIFVTYPDDVSHDKSARMIQERGTNKRDLAINFIKDNKYLSDELPSFSKEEIKQIMDVAIKSTINAGTGETICYSQIYNLINHEIIKRDKGSSIMIADFVVSSGLKRNRDGRYEFKSDEEILKDIEELKANIESIPKNIDAELIEELVEENFGISNNYYKDWQKDLKTGQFSFEDIESFSNIRNKNISELSKNEKDFCLDFLNKRLDILSKGNDKNSQKFGIVYIDEEAEEFYDEDLGMYIKSQKPGLLLYMNGKDKIEKLSKISGIDINSMEKEMYETSDLSIMAKKDREIQNLNIPHVENIKGYNNGLNTDCDFTKCETMNEVYEQLDRYTKLFSRFYEGEKIEFDSSGNIKEKDEKENIIFSDQEIGKATINTPTDQKDKMLAQIIKDEKELEEQKEGQNK